jgi:hypothetical protein
MAHIGPRLIRRLWIKHIPFPGATNSFDFIRSIRSGDTKEQ